MDHTQHPPPEPRAEPRVQISLRCASAGGEWQADVAVDGQQLHFDTLLMLIGWLTRLDAQGKGIR